MAVSDEEKRSIRADVYSDEKGYRGAFLNCVKHDDVQAGLFRAVIRGGMWWLLFGGGVLLGIPFLIRFISGG